MNKSELDIPNSFPGGLGQYRPFVTARGESVYTTKDGKNEPTVVPALYFRKDWIRFDKRAMSGFRLASPVLHFLLTEELQYALPAPTEEPIYMEECGTASIENPDESKKFQIEQIPLPVCHMDCSANELWAAGFAVGEQVDMLFEKSLVSPDTATVHTMYEAINHLQSIKFYGPYAMLLPDNRVGQEKLELPIRPPDSIGGCIVCYTPMLYGKGAIVFQLTPDVISVILGLALTVIINPNKDSGEFKVLTVIVPQARDTGGVVRISW